MPSATVPDQPRYLTAAEVAALLRVSVQALRHQARAGKIPRPLRVSGKRLWSRAELERVLDRAERGARHAK